MPDIKLHRRLDHANCWKVYLTVDEEEASRLWVFVKRLRIGCAKVRIGGIGGVGTNEKHRLKGYASLVMDESTVFMADKNYDIGFLYGIQDFYHRFGYGVAFVSPVLSVKTDDLLSAKTVLPTRVMKKTDGLELARLYNRLNARKTATAVRTPSWQHFHISANFNKPGKTVLVLNPGGRIAGYATYAVHDERFVISEIGGTGNTVFETLAAVLRRRARRSGIETLTFHLPLEDPFAAFCARYGSRMEIRSPRNSGPMARIIHLRPLMEKLVPEFNCRLKTSQLSWEGVLALETDIGTVGLDINNGSVAITQGQSKVKAELPQMILTQLVLGYRSVADISGDANVKIPPRCLPIFDVLFPKHDAYMWWSDRF